ncbi:Cof-type HAD-IIB family hydrolase [Parabacteroides sp. PF5-6]|uniref:Cof-type HAD-IIB family hydrolase n=1 Tax=Parabacteroides sp. PF5-6 TaxID=1742403 RepID=UPI002406AA5D|nr:Cof-type HAD-IIB family hydrolase [Parabacteroides sp. PF5-6]MDF9831510.1 Cof subfamily protein (haloacid dehalogenase superfamily) [Parabacteroides sp. PF5-6]
MIKAVFFDIDGTLVSFKTHAVPQSTRDSIRLLREKGIKVFIATGRRLEAVNNLGDLEFDGYITLNGGYCLAGREEVIYKHRIAAEDIEGMLRYQETVQDFPVAIVQDRDIFMNYRDEAVDEIFDLLNFPAPPIRPLREVADQAVYQVIAFFREHQEEQIMAAMPHCEATRWNPLFSDVVPQGSSKSVGIEKIRKHFGIALEEIMAFGDGGNDIQMLRHVALGVAMGNAEDDVKQAADYVTDSVDNDGIYKALKHFGVL